MYTWLLHTLLVPHTYGGGTETQSRWVPSPTMQATMPRFSEILSLRRSGFSQILLQGLPSAHISFRPSTSRNLCFTRAVSLAFPGAFRSVLRSDPDVAAPTLELFSFVP